MAGEMDLLWAPVGEDYTKNGLRDLGLHRQEFYQLRLIRAIYWTIQSVFGSKSALALASILRQPPCTTLMF